MRREPKFTDIVHYVEDRIRGGQFKIGDKLPSVNSFHIQFSLSRSSARPSSSFCFPAASCFAASSSLRQPVSSVFRASASCHPP